ncbi:hypothetical protein QFC21_002362 [Naganishia friedmannii]|uniref:Uncharacterized protein n=1 Tax=Naganishia friedmannii TaxID=89922 RepID=A0ACC2VWR6_9TREE|nr:hypothetical protein QFC21_002362 [Naganishia friedmannii]
MLDLVSHTHVVVHGHLESLRRQQKEFNSKLGQGKREELVHYKQMLGGLNKIEAVTTKFVLRYPMASASAPSLQVVAKQDTAVFKRERIETTAIASDAPRVSGQIQLTQWRSITSLTAAGTAILELCLPVILSYRNAGISESKYYTTLPRLLSEVKTLQPGDVRDSRLQALLSMTDHFIVANQQALLQIKHSKDEEGSKRRIASAMYLTARFRKQYPIGSFNDNTSISGGIHTFDQRHLPIVAQSSSITFAADMDMLTDYDASEQRKPLEQKLAKRLEADHIVTTSDDDYEKRNYSLYEKDQISIRETLYSCRRAGITEPHLYREALELLRAANSVPDLVDKASKTHDLWRKVQCLIEMNMEKIEDGTNGTQRTSSSYSVPKDLTARLKLVANESAHERHLERIHKFLCESPSCIGALQGNLETALKSKHLGSLRSFDDSSDLATIPRKAAFGTLSFDVSVPQPEVSIKVPGAASTQGSIAKSRFSEDTSAFHIEKTALISRAFTGNLAKWEGIMLSVDEKSLLEILLPLILSFRELGLGQPSIHRVPLQLLQCFTKTTSKDKRDLKIQKLLQYTHELVQQYQEKLRAQHEVAKKEANSSEFSAQSKDPEALSLHLVRLTKAIEAMKAFGTKYPLSLMSASSMARTTKSIMPSEQVVESETQSRQQNVEVETSALQTSSYGGFPSSMYSHALFDNVFELNSSQFVGKTSTGTQALGFSSDGPTLTSLCFWPKLPFSAEEAKRLRLIVTPILLFQSCGFSQALNLREPLRIVNLLSRCQSEETRISLVQDLVLHAHVLVHEHSKSLRDLQSKLALKKGQVTGKKLQHCTSILGQVNKAVATTAEFLVRYPLDPAFAPPYSEPKLGVETPQRVSGKLRPNSDKLTTMGRGNDTRYSDSLVPLTAWRTVTSLTATETAVLQACIPVLLTHRFSGISDSADYEVVPQLLGDLQASEPGYDRDSKLQNLLSITERFIITNQKALLQLKESNDAEGPSANLTRPLFARRCQIANALSVTARFRERYPLVDQIITPVFGSEVQAPDQDIASTYTATGFLSAIHNAYTSLAALVTNRLRAISKNLTLRAMVRAKQTEMFVRKLPMATNATRALKRVRGTKRVSYPLTTSIFTRRQLGFTRADQAKANDQSRPTAPVTDWRSQGFHDYGHWISSKLHQMTPREAAHVIHLSAPKARSPFAKAGSHSQWVTHLQANFKNIESFGQEINDERIHVHLKEYAVTSDVSINAAGQLQRSFAKALHDKLVLDSSALQVATDASFKVYEDGRSEAGGGILIDSNPPIRDICYLGQHVVSSGSAELAVLLRGLQIVRDVLQTPPAQTNVGNYRRIVFATDAIMSLQALTGSRISRDPSETQRMTRIAALCRMAAYDILRHNRNLDSIHFTWLPRQTGGNDIADKLAESGRYSGTEFANSN